MTLRNWLPLHLVILYLSLLGCDAQRKVGNADSADSPEQLVAIVEDNLQELQAYSFRLDVEMDLTAQGVEQKMDSMYDVKIERPNRWAIVLESGMMGGSSVSDGENLTRYVQMVKKYSIEPLEEAGNTPGIDESFMLLGAGGFSQLFMGEGLKDWLLEGVTKSELLEKQEINGSTYTVAKFEKKNGTNIELAVSTGDRPLVRQVVVKPDFTKLAQGQAGIPKDMKLDLTLNFTDWNTDAKYSQDDFVFSPPPGAEKVDSLFSQLSGEPELHPLVGEQAPTFTAMDLNGQAVALEQFAGENVVILDFWATWCGPCVDALPIIARVAENFKDKHVVFYAVNEGETSETIREFLSEENLDIPVLLDEDGIIGSLFQVSGIPQTVLIDSVGKVQVVHVGFGGNLENQLTQELEEILAGEDLASAAREEQEGQ